MLRGVETGSTCLIVNAQRRRMDVEGGFFAAGLLFCVELITLKAIIGKTDLRNY